MTQEYKFGDAIPAQDGKQWSDDPKVYALIAENEALRRDAERYRWLRGMLYDDQIIAATGRVLHSETLDASIDAAMQEQPR